MKWLISSILFLSACTHTDAKYWPNPYSFPAKFFVEQTLEIRTRHDLKTLRAQVERESNLINLVLTDPQTSMVLVKLKLEKGKEPNFLYQAPILEKTDFAAMKIARAIQDLYETQSVPLRESEYKVRGPSARYTYTWAELRGSGSCQFPENIKLNFADERYEVTISLLELDCGA